MVLIFRCAGSDRVGLFITQQVMTVQSEAEGGVDRSTGVSESSSARDYGLSTDFDERMDKLTTEKVALPSGLADTAA